MNGTEVITSTSGACFVEKHRNTATRYFNGRRYTVATHHDFYQHVIPGIVRQPGDCFSIYFRYVTLHDTRHIGLSRKIGHVYKTFSGTQPTELMRAMAIMVPDDIQAVPF